MVGVGGVSRVESEGSTWGRGDSVMGLAAAEFRDTKVIRIGILRAEAELPDLSPYPSLIEAMLRFESEILALTASYNAIHIADASL
jgi:hypothetical protein